jgi:putative transposase
MKKSKFSETQIVSILKQGDAGVPVKDLCRQPGQLQRFGLLLHRRMQRLDTLEGTSRNLPNRCRQ